MIPLADLKTKVTWRSWESKAPTGDGDVCYPIAIPGLLYRCYMVILWLFEGSLEVKLPTIWTDEKQSREEAERRERLEERRVEEKE